MDKYLVRTPRLQDSANLKKPPQKKAKQSTLESLAGVVVLEDLRSKKELLENKDTSKESKIKALKELSSKKPCKEVLVQVGIGKTVKNLSKEASDPDVKRLAGEVYLAWRRELERRVEAEQNRIQVLSDLETERLRAASKKFLFSALSAKNIKNAEKLASAAEEEIFSKSKKLVGKNYRRLSRRVVFHLRGANNLSESLTKDTIRDIINTVARV